MVDTCALEINKLLLLLISLAYFRLLFKLSLIRFSTTRGFGTSILSRWSLQKLLRMNIHAGKPETLRLVVRDVINKKIEI